jgi:hypothetical protein
MQLTEWEERLSGVRRPLAGLMARLATTTK